jgi:hypothetical protein
VKKLIPFLDPAKGAKLDGALGSLHGAKLLGALPVHVDYGMPRWTIRHQCRTCLIGRQHRYELSKKP